MPIYHKCKSCKNDFKKGSECPKCGTKLPRTGKKYIIKVQIEGNRVTKSANNRARAERIEAELIAGLTTGQISTNKSNHSLDDVWEIYLENAETRGKKAVKSLKSRYKSRIQPLFGKRKLKSIKPAELERQINAWLKELSPKSTRHMIETISRLFRYATRLDMYAGSNPCERVELPKVNNAVVRSLTSQQMKSLLGALCEIEENDSVIDANFIRFLLFTGCRAGEAMKLQWKDIDFVSKQLHLRDPKGGIDQWIPLNDTAIGMLTKHRQEIPRENPLVFPSKVTGKQRNEFRWPWKKAKNIAELPEEFRLHDLRHTFASWLASSGKVDIYTLQTLLTHKNVSTTQRYAHLFPGVVHRGSEVFSDMVSDLEDDNVVRVDFG